MSEPEARRPRSAAPDRRRERWAVEMSGFLTRAGGISHAIEVTDLNYGGCGIRTPVELEPGEHLQLSVLDRGSIPAEVSWCRGGAAGLDFEAPVKPERKQVERRARRAAVIGEISLRGAGHHGYRVNVLDLSTDGCKVELVERPKAGERMRVKFEGLEALDARVCWVEGHTAGLEFEHRIHRAVLDLLIARLAADKR